MNIEMYSRNGGAMNLRMGRFSDIDYCGMPPDPNPKRPNWFKRLILKIRTLLTNTDNTVK